MLTKRCYECGSDDIVKEIHRTEHQTGSGEIILELETVEYECQV